MESEFKTAQLHPENNQYYEVGKKIISDLLKSNELRHLEFIGYFNTASDSNEVLKCNIFAYHPEKNTVSFQSPSVRYYILENSDMFIN